MVGRGEIEFHWPRAAERCLYLTIWQVASINHTEIVAVEGPAAGRASECMPAAFGRFHG